MSRGVFRLMFAAFVVTMTGVGGCSSRKEPAAGQSPPAGGAQVEGGGLPRLDLRAKSLANLRNLGQAYYMALAGGGRPPRGPDELKAFLEGGDRLLKSPRDGAPYEFAWGTDPAKLARGSANTMLAWESTSEPGAGGRCALFADGSTRFLSREEFAQLHLAQGK